MKRTLPWLAVAAGIASSCALILEPPEGHEAPHTVSCGPEECICETGYQSCDSEPGCETLVAGDPTHCGQCGLDCFGGACRNGRCEPAIVLCLTPAASGDDPLAGHPQERYSTFVAISEDELALNVLGDIHRIAWRPGGAEEPVTCVGAPAPTPWIRGPEGGRVVHQQLVGDRLMLFGDAACPSSRRLIVAGFERDGPGSSDWRADSPWSPCGIENGGFNVAGPGTYETLAFDGAKGADFRSSDALLSVLGTAFGAEPAADKQHVVCLIRLLEHGRNLQIEGDVSCVPAVDIGRPTQTPGRLYAPVTLGVGDALYYASFEPGALSPPAVALANVSPEHPYAGVEDALFVVSRSDDVAGGLFTGLVLNRVGFELPPEPARDEQIVPAFSSITAVPNGGDAVLLASYGGTLDLVRYADGGFVHRLDTPPSLESHLLGALTVVCDGSVGFVVFVDHTGPDGTLSASVKRWRAPEDWELCP